MAGNVPLQALVTRGATPLGPAALVTSCSPVRSPAGTRCAGYRVRSLVFGWHEVRWLEG